MTPINDVEDQALAGLRQGLREGRAVEVLEACSSKREKAGRLGRLRRQLKLGILQVQALQLLGREAEALALLSELLRSDVGQQLRASFLEEGPLVPRLLQQLQAQNAGSSLAQQEVLASLVDLALAQGSPAATPVKASAPREALAEGAPRASQVASASPDSSGESVAADEAGAESTLAAGAPSGLSARELQILQCLAAGMPNKQIASNLHISEPTVKFHLRNVNHKLDARNRTHAVFIARERGWVR
ncbi:MAG: LuxR C-terminal-related transcriptional regulator [Burkholderiaceae bacterium]|nr:LuxR C-terminal-related transcriptional regulator [Burkholderiaceae bacterium]